jgi:hypothetical protein
MARSVKDKRGKCKGKKGEEEKVKHVNVAGRDKDLALSRIIEIL